jgi:hypothetical protein
VKERLKILEKKLLKKKMQIKNIVKMIMS